MPLETFVDVENFEAKLKTKKGCKEDTVCIFEMELKKKTKLEFVQVLIMQFIIDIIFQILFLKQQSAQNSEIPKCARTMLRSLFSRKIAINLTFSRRSGEKILMEKDLPILKSCLSGKFIFILNRLRWLKIDRFS